KPRGSGRKKRMLLLQQQKQRRPRRNPTISGIGALRLPQLLQRRKRKRRAPKTNQKPKDFHHHLLLLLSRRLYLSQSLPHLLRRKQLMAGMTGERPRPS